ncbi:hypothetical protein GLAREA_02758 [Glarea lozoyensis ATCC 20868]|uniref:Uncharacterized protein n=2 Tax=Glarea lozoyensis TaxID=101852 RepID=S3CNV4_GLAL2|nr:uncharacterized protein GLAREA_02758 [Glarea lozoyensis ATCC 20868]EHL00892.1 hypothetical protein M7I_3286 [Glarea lozoyensis 74030]EPE26844.1 hypothetical protein GLAREA_02758 [Glarea lozoyensis ATCC 20868]
MYRQEGYAGFREDKTHKQYRKEKSEYQPLFNQSSFKKMALERAKKDYPPGSFAQLQQIELCYGYFQAWKNLSGKAIYDQKYELLELMRTFHRLQDRTFHLAYFEIELDKLRKELDSTYINDIDIQRLEVDEIHEYQDKRKNIEARHDKCKGIVRKLEREKERASRKWEEIVD